MWVVRFMVVAFSSFLISCSVTQPSNQQQSQEISVSGFPLPAHVKTLSNKTTRHEQRTDEFYADRERPLDLVVLVDESPFSKDRIPALMQQFMNEYARVQKEGWDLDITVFAKAGASFAAVSPLVAASPRMRVVPYPENVRSMHDLLASFLRGEIVGVNPRKNVVREALIITDRDAPESVSLSDEVQFLSEQMQAVHLMAGQTAGNDAEFTQCYIRERAERLASLQSQSGGLFFDLCAASENQWASKFWNLLSDRRKGFALKYQPDLSADPIVEVDGLEVDHKQYQIDSQARLLIFHPDYGIPAAAKVSVHYTYQYQVH